ncbi:uncharacterized protein LOC111385389 [Olea europaea var. sylvestris]|uniref:uncharacterized protein LOC111385389 n=1 Tax=Olea europaea var. sylvestris TaxID=158386 RepID=UPI000C1CEC20|nr:uncharacterized protein LOC111385389 [Olea europaea var. sylvestris]
MAALWRHLSDTYDFRRGGQTEVLEMAVFWTARLSWTHSYYHSSTGILAELRATLDGLLLARGLGISAIWIEVDSMLAIHCIIKGGGPWTIQGILRQIRDVICLDRDTVSHIYREGNQVADSLASEGWDHQHYQEYGPLDLPRQIRALVQIDRYGLPSFRSS